MADEYEIFEFLEADNAGSNASKRQKRRRLREDINPFHLEEAEFIKRYRLSKELTHKLCDELRPHMKKPVKSTDLSVETKVLTALSFYATGSYQRPIGSTEGHVLAQQTVSSTISQVTALLNSETMRCKYITFPDNDEERNQLKMEFYNKFKIPGVVGCIDCTHVAIIRPTLNEERYFCRKQCHSLNVQLICDANSQILSVDSSHGGASPNSSIWLSHPLNSHLEDLSNTKKVWLLGDAGYPLRITMMTPILGAASDLPEAHYRNVHIRARSTIERTIGLLKARFRCLLVHRVLHYAPEVAGSIVNACVILHNICNRANVPVQELTEEEAMREAQLQYTYSTANAQQSTYDNNIALQPGVDVRNALIQELWENHRHVNL